MAYADAFAECMAGANVPVPASAVADESSFGEAVAYVKSWFDGLDGTLKKALDDASEHAEKVTEHLVEANVAPALPDLMKAFDSTSGIPLSTFLEWCVHCAQQAASQGGATPAEGA